jgi:carbamoyltransferase
MKILGISCFYHDSAACLVRDGAVVAAASEERFTRQKNSALFPVNAVNFCLQNEGLSIYDIDYIGFYEKPFLKFHRVLMSHLRSYPFSFPNFMDTMPSWLDERLVMPLVFQKELGYKGKSVFIKHHLSHAASTFLVSPFREAAIFTCDGVGEWSTIAIGKGSGSAITMIKEMQFPDSLGLLYTALTTYLGFEALSGEGKIMGLAGYGKPSYADALKKMMVIRPDGSFRIDRDFFGFNKGDRMYTQRLVRTLGPARKPGSAIEQRHSDIAASLQQIAEQIIIAIARELHKETKLDKLCCAGGVFLNCIANGKILEETPFKEIFIQPAAGDCGGALGAATYIYYSLLKNERIFVMRSASLGPEFPPNKIKKALVNSGVAFKELDDNELFPYIARLVSHDKIIGWFQGRMEFGPRALGSRSIIANPCNFAMKDLLNDRVKHRESFRPYAPIVLEERASEFFEGKQFNRFMLLAGTVREDKRSVIPAVTHVDNTARVQVVNRELDARLWQLIKEFENVTGVPVLINTSFNVKGEPIVCSPEDAIRDFTQTQMDCLVLGNYVAEK